MTDYVGVHGGICVRDITDGWKRFVHINGGVYFYHPRYRLITDNDITDARWRGVIETAWADYRRECRSDGSIRFLLDDADIVIRYFTDASQDDAIPDPDEEDPEVYFLSHSEGSETRISYEDDDPST